MHSSILGVGRNLGAFVTRSSLWPGRQLHSASLLSDPPVSLQIAGPKATLTLNRPKTGNTLDGDVQALLTKHLNDIRNNDEIRAVVLTGTGKYFCTGMNVGSGEKGEIAKSHARSRSMVNNDEQFERASKMFKTLEEYPKPIIALVQGPCYGGGAGLAMACDIRIATSKAITFTLSEVKLGFIPAIISRIIVREWGVPLSREAMLSARPIPAMELLGTRAVHYVLSEGESSSQKVDDIIKELSLGAPVAQANVKRLVSSAANSSVKEHLAVTKGFFYDMLGPCEEGAYGVKCFQEKKKPDWTTLSKQNLAR